MRFLPLLPLLALAAACSEAPAQPPPAPAPEAPGPSFPAPDRPVASIVSSQWSDEASRDNEGEAARVLELLAIRPGLTVADIGAGSGYYTVRLAPAVGPTGTVFATDIMPDYLNRLRSRIAQRGLANVRLILGGPDDARLPPASTDVALMVHMYHEIEQPFALLWRLHESLRPGPPGPDGVPRRPVVAIIDADRPTGAHGTPPDLLRCELESVGYRQLALHQLTGGNYLALFEPVARPAPEAIRPCRL